MTKREFIEAVSKQQSNDGPSKKAVEEIIANAFLVMSDAIKKTGRFTYPSFGTFTVTERAARTGRNPRTGETLEIKASKSVKFKPTPNLKQGL